MGPNFTENTQWNQSRIVGLEKQQIEQERDKAVSGKRKVAAIIGMVALVAVLAGVIALFVI